MALLCNMAVVDIMAMLDIMGQVIIGDDRMLSSLASNSRAFHAEALVADLFEEQGWSVERLPEYGGERPDLVVRRGGQCYVVEVKSLREARADRVIPLLSQAILQAQVQAHAVDSSNAKPLAVISVENASESLSRQVTSFVQRYAPKVAVGLVSNAGLRYFRGLGLETLNAEQPEPRWNGGVPTSQPANIFSDLNQWMLKVMLAPDIPNHLLHAPRKRYQSGAELAEAAGVSAMSASRFLQQLRNEGYLGDARYLGLVRRQELFRRWRSAVMRPAPELPMRFLIRGTTPRQIEALLALQQGASCLGLFSAADVLGLGHVSGVPPYIYVEKLPRSDDKNWRALTATSPSEVPDMIVRQALAPKSVFRGAIQKGGVTVADVIQVWLDVANHASRGEEQANFIYDKVLRPIIGD
jgi:hypothetical protein